MNGLQRIGIEKSSKGSKASVSNFNNKLVTLVNANWVTFPFVTYSIILKLSLGDLRLDCVKIRIGLSNFLTYFLQTICCCLLFVFMCYICLSNFCNTSARLGH